MIADRRFQNTAVTKRARLQIPLRLRQQKSLGGPDHARAEFDDGGVLRVIIPDTQTVRLGAKQGITAENDMEERGWHCKSLEVREKHP